VRLHIALSQRVRNFGLQATILSFEPFLRRINNPCSNASESVKSVTSMLMIALGVKMTSAGPVIFKQRRYGFKGEEIYVWKFRSIFKGFSSNQAY